MRGLLTSMNQQTEVIEELSKDLQHQRQVMSLSLTSELSTYMSYIFYSQIAAFSNLTTSQLSGDNSLLKDEVEMLRGELMEANDTIGSLRSQIRLKTSEAERRGKAKQVLVLNKNCMTSVSV